MHGRNCPGEDHTKLKVLYRWPAAPQYKLNLKKGSRNIYWPARLRRKYPRLSFIREVTVANDCVPGRFYGTNFSIQSLDKSQEHRMCSVFKDDGGRVDARCIKKLTVCHG